MGIFQQSENNDDTPQTKEDFLERIEKFVEKDQNSLYLIDGTKGVQRSVICRQTANGGRTCLNLNIDGVTLFKKMQEVNFFCSLPAEIGKTHFECRKM